MAPTSSNALVSSLPPFSQGVIIILAIIGISLIVIALVLLGLDRQAMGWVINQWQHWQPCQHLLSPRSLCESMQLPIQTPPPLPPTLPPFPEPSPPLPIPAPSASLWSFDSINTFGGTQAYTALEVYALRGMHMEVGA
ncbi:hypothetical protein BS47DRAFT_1392479 [Hydnum rufescens UP504]|uniref:Uncharacterized protein n=1 Tax=Hydnum rufescens UP504 TaxID=1448309 RepID=A0A9P6AZ59_9AGAM|nr:hypothetical protein BS47DRAFT_1392479 [Hydnum rufescens UP504]